MTWQNQLHRGDTTTQWTPRAAADHAHHTITHTSQWLGTNQAALMRYLPEQQAALRWWASIHDRLAPVDEIMPQWLAHFHGIAVAADTDLQHADLSSTASLMHVLCVERGHQIRTGMTVSCSPAVIAVLATLSQAGGYAIDPMIDVDALGSDVGTIVFPQNLHRPGPREDGEHVPGADATQPLRAVTWMTEDVDGGRLLRVLDWTDISGSQSSTGDARLDQQVHEHMKRHNVHLPPILFNGEWRRSCATELSTSQARRRITSAAADHDGGPWYPGKVLADEPFPLAVRVLAVLGDAITAGLVTSCQIPITDDGGQDTIATVYSEPST